MTTRSLILSPHEVRAALRGELGLIVRPVTPQPTMIQDMEPQGYSMIPSWDGETELHMSKCPLGGPGDRLIGKETWADVNTDSGPAFTYRADNGLHFCQDDAFPVEYERYPGMSFAMWCGDLWRGEAGHTWRRASNMPAWASRITLEVQEVQGVRCVRCTGITYEDAEKSGVADALLGTHGMSPLTVLRDNWTAKYGRRYPWETSWAWAVNVRRVEG